jgi:hypothetical protein
MTLTAALALAADEKPYWDLERARIGDTRQVPVELVVNVHPRSAMQKEHTTI